MERFTDISGLINSWLIPLAFFIIVLYGYIKKVEVYSKFVEGAKDGFSTAVMIMPYLVVILSAIAIFRESGAMQFFSTLVGYVIPPKYFPPDLVLLALTKPLSGGAARGVMLDIFQNYGPDSFEGFLASCMQGSTETTFYVIAVYLGAVGITKSRHIIIAGLSAEFIAFFVSALIANLMWIGKR